VRWNLWTGPFGVATMAFAPYFGSQVNTQLLLLENHVSIAIDHTICRLFRVLLLI
jgi:hypothetical protein